MILVGIGISLSICFLLYFFLSLPKGPPVLHTHGALLGHRGCVLPSPEPPENTISSCQYAIKSGANGFEIDVILSSDGVPMVIHDFKLDRLFHATGFVHETSGSELQRLTFRQDGSEHVPTFDELMTTVICADNKKRPLLFIETKEYRRPRLLASQIVSAFRKYNLHSHAVVISFSPYILYFIRKSDPSIPTTLLARRDLISLLFAPKTITSRILCAVADWLLVSSSMSWVPSFIGASAIGLHDQLLPPPHLMVEREGYVSWWMRKRKYDVNVWVVDNETEQDHLRSCGCSVTTNNPRSVD